MSEIENKEELENLRRKFKNLLDDIFDKYNPENTKHKELLRDVLKKIRTVDHDIQKDIESERNQETQNDQSDEEDKNKRKRRFQGLRNRINRTTDFFESEFEDAKKAFNDFFGENDSD